MKLHRLILVAVFTLGSVIAIPGGGAWSGAKPHKLTGAIVSYECGDNCYLTIRDKKKKDHTGLCAAPECDPWNEQTQMPEENIGKLVEVTVKVGGQYDGSGTVVGQMDAFSKIVFK